MQATFITLFDDIATLFVPIFNFIGTGTGGSPYVGGLIVFSIALTIIGSILHFLLART